VQSVSGQKVRCLVDKQQEAGIYEVDFNGYNLSSGVYIYCLNTENKVLAKKMLLTK